MVNEETYKAIFPQLNQQGVTLVAVSKLKTVADIKKLYDLGQRDFGENYVQELLEKQPALPPDIRWHFIGHLQSNKVKYIAPFIHLIQSVDSEKLLKEIDKQAEKNKRKISCLLQIYIAEEETKFGFDEKELHETANQTFNNVTIAGLMGMATFTNNIEKLRSEFLRISSIYKEMQTGTASTLNIESATFNFLSLGMSDDYQTAIECGSNMVRIGSLLFGRR